ncbi:MAG: phosphoribosylamine--glycine ligase [Bdellovibrionales bacterium]|nr:phosphoribosylamine--glycine ligase [Bdellovibrionales bacterium]
MKVLVLGSGGREHALSWRLARDPGVTQVFVMPGNPGMLSETAGTGAAVEPLLENLSLVQTIEFCAKNKIDFVMVGPEKFLFEGWVDELTRSGIPTVGPTRAAARLEESKSFSKQFMTENKIPTARFYNVSTEAEALRAVDQTQSWAGVAVKLSGPALGKGVIVCDSTVEARDIVKKFYADKTLGIEDGMVIEEKLSGREVSLFYACLDDEFKFLASACDHKRLLDHNQGPNTGGMGAICPSPWVDFAFLKRIEESVVRPTLDGMKKAGSPYRGILFVGLMGELLLEYNVRFGDPETQAIMPLLQGNFAEFLLAIGKGDITAFRTSKISTEGVSIHVVKAAKGYPGLFGEKIESGIEISSSPSVSAPNQQWFFAGVKDMGGRLVSGGGRVLGLTAWGRDSSEVRARAYGAISQVKFSGEQYRKDIGASAGGAS